VISTAMEKERVGKMRNIAYKAGAATVAGISGVLLWATTAYAQVAPTPYSASTAKTDSTDYIGQLTNGLVPVMLAIVGGTVGIIVLGWGLRTVSHKVRGSAHF